MSNADRLIEVLAEAYGDDESEVSGDVVNAMVTALRPLVAENFVTVMTGSDDTFTGTFSGPEGLREGWSDWLDTFETVRLEVEAVQNVGENVIALARQVGVTRVGGVELEQPSAAVFKFRGDEIVQVEFHLDRDRAYASAREPA